MWGTKPGLTLTQSHVPPSPLAILFSMTYKELACKNSKTKQLHIAYNKTKHLACFVRSAKAKGRSSLLNSVPYF
jgi:hypothetical protein